MRLGTVFLAIVCFQAIEIGVQQILAQAQDPNTGLQGSSEQVIQDGLNLYGSTGNVADDSLLKSILELGKQVSRLNNTNSDDSEVISRYGFVWNLNCGCGNASVSYHSQSPANQKPVDGGYGQGTQYQQGGYEPKNSGYSNGPALPATGYQASPPATYPSPPSTGYHQANQPAQPSYPSNPSYGSPSYQGSGYTLPGYGFPIQNPIYSTGGSYGQAPTYNTGYGYNQGSAQGSQGCCQGSSYTSSLPGYAVPTAPSDGYIQPPPTPPVQPNGSYVVPPPLPPPGPTPGYAQPQPSPVYPAPTLIPGGYVPQNPTCCLVPPPQPVNKGCSGSSTVYTVSPTDQKTINDLIARGYKLIDDVRNALQSCQGSYGQGYVTVKPGNYVLPPSPGGYAQPPASQGYAQNPSGYTTGGGYVPPSGNYAQPPQPGYAVPPPPPLVPGYPTPTPCNPADCGQVYPQPQPSGYAIPPNPGYQTGPSGYPTPYNPGTPGNWTYPYLNGTYNPGEYQPGPGPQPTYNPGPPQPTYNQGPGPRPQPYKQQPYDGQNRDFSKPQNGDSGQDPIPLDPPTSLPTTRRPHTPQKSVKMAQPRYFGIENQPGDFELAEHVNVLNEEKREFGEHKAEKVNKTPKKAHVETHATSGVEKAESLTILGTFLTFLMAFCVF